MEHYIKTGYESRGSSGTAPSNPTKGQRYTVYKYWTGFYGGTVTKPDTRVYRQDYSGTVYGASVNYYTYTVTINCNVNTVKPAITPTLISDQILNNTVNIEAASTLPCYRMSAKLEINGVLKEWLGEQSPTGNETGKFTYKRSYKLDNTGTGQYKITFYSRPRR